MPESDGEKRRGNHCTLVAKPINQSSNQSATILISECRTALGIQPVKIEGIKVCLKTQALLATGSDVIIDQRGLLNSVGLRASLVSLSISTAKCTETWLTELQN